VAVLHTVTKRSRVHQQGRSFAIEGPLSVTQTLVQIPPGLATSWIDLISLGGAIAVKSESFTRVYTFPLKNVEFLRISDEIKRL